MSDVVVSSKSTIRRWIEKVANATGQEITKSTAREAALTLRQLGEGGAVGMILGAVDAEVGLDVKVGSTTIPVDLVTTALGVGGAMYFSSEEFSHDLRNVGSHSATIFAYRKTKDLLKLKGQPGLEDHDAIKGSGETTSDVGEEDPVVEAARDL